jgi:CheY-like chemotaxis protein
MVAVPVPALPLTSRIRPRTALVASADRNFRQRLSETLTGLRWQVREADGGAQAWAEAEAAPPEAVIVDSWLPDLDLAEFLKDFRAFFPEVDLVTANGSIAQESPRGPYRQELLYALRRSQDNDTAIWNAAPALNKRIRRWTPSTPTRGRFRRFHPRPRRHFRRRAPRQTGCFPTFLKPCRLKRSCPRSSMNPHPVSGCRK